MRHTPLDSWTVLVLDPGAPEGDAYTFPCFAEDLEHAYEQAADAYPEATLLGAQRLPASSEAFAG